MKYLGEKNHKDNIYVFLLTHLYLFVKLHTNW